MTRRRAALAAAAAAACAAAGWWLAGRATSHALPDAVVIADTVAELSRTLDPAAVVAEDAADPVRAGIVRPGNRLAGEGEREGLIAPPASRLRFALDVPPDGVLELAVGVQGDGTRDRTRSGVRFAVVLDGRERWSRSVNPAGAKRDRRWHPARIDLGPAAGRRATVELVTTADRPGQPLAGVPAWSGVRLVRETRRPRQAAAPGSPNVVVLLVDTLRADRVGVYGARPSPTPALDGLAASGLVFGQAVAQSSWTLPSVSSLFTGLHPRSHGAIGDAGGDGDAAWGFLSDDVVTWAEVATRAGITTVGVSANPLVSRGTNLAQGFETFVELPWDPEAKRWGSAPVVNRTFLDWLAANRRHRFVAWLHYMEPHDPYAPPEALRPPAPPGTPADVARGWALEVSRRLGRPGAPPLPPEQLAYLRALYDGDVRAWDAELPHLLDGLRRYGVADRTVVIVTADHGEEFLEHGLLLHRAHLFDELLRVPLIVAGPGIPAGRRDDQVQGIDLFPTLSARLGLTPPAGLPGRDLLAGPADRTAFAETDGQANDGARRALIAARRPDAKLILAPGDGAPALYDLARDPGELTPLSPETGMGPPLRTALDGFVRDAPPPPAPTGRDPGLLDRLRALGYAQ